MSAWRSIALAAVGSAVSIVAGPPAGIEPWLGVSVSLLVAFFWYIASATREKDENESADRWVVLETYLNLQEAYVTRSALQASDIPCLMPEEHTAGARVELAPAIGVRIMVPASALERARDVVASKGKNRV